MKTLRAVVCLSAMFFVCSCSGGGVTTNPQTPVGTPVSLKVFNGFFKGYTTAGSGTQLSFNNMTGSARFNNMTGAKSHGRCSGSYIIVVVGPTTFETSQVTESTTALAVQPDPNAPQPLLSQIPTSIVSQKYFLASNGNLFRITNTPGTLLYKPTSFTMPPNPANVGDFGTIASLDGSDGSKLDIGWELSPEFHGNSIMIITSITRNIIPNIITTTEVDKYYLDRGGNPYKLDITVTTGGLTITLSGNKT
jgi:hypothetical protein